MLALLSLSSPARPRLAFDFDGRGHAKLRSTDLEGEEADSVAEINLKGIGPCFGGEHQECLSSEGQQHGSSL